MKIQLPSLLAVVLGAQVLNSVAAQPTSSGSFSLVGSMSQFRRVQTATLLSDGKVLVAGGAPFAQAATSEIYDPVAQTWTNSGPLSTGRGFHTATLLQDGRVVVTGGQSANQLLASTEVYDLPSGRWSSAGPLNEARESHTATLLTNGLILVAGGFPNIASAEVFDPASGQWELTSSMNAPRFQQIWVESNRAAHETATVDQRLAAFAGNDPAKLKRIASLSPERKAEFLLSNAVSPKDYRRARKAVQQLGLDPDAIPHRRLE